MTTMRSNTPVLAKSMDYVNVIACLLSSVYDTLGMVVTPRYKRLTIEKIAKRFKREGYGFFTKSLPRLGKALDRALLGQNALDSIGFSKETNSQIPKLFGNLFKRVFDLNGEVLPNPCVSSIRALRQLTFMFYKYELKYDQILETKVLKDFRQAEIDVHKDVLYLSDYFDGTFGTGSLPLRTRSSRQRCRYDRASSEEVDLLRKARRLVTQLFDGFDLSCITPRHGPGVVSTKETMSDKFVFKRMNPRAQMMFPFDKHMFVNMDHLCDDLHSLENVDIKESSAQVVLVPKDSRGPRVISCEPLENQWLQQGIMRAMVQWIEHHPLTRNDIHFTDQEPNRMAALAGSYHGELATLDLKEASDRVSVWLVEQLFPEPILGALLATRSLSTKMPDGTVLPLQKFAPMGSATCFPVLATTVWAILRAGMAGADGKTVLVYGDDVIVETASAAHAIEQLETFGLHVNRDKSCISGLFRESCGMDAYYGEDVTPVRFRTVWSSLPAAGPFESWVAYANSLYSKGYVEPAMFIAERLKAVYGPVPVELEGEVWKQNKNGSFHLSPAPTLSYPALVFDYDGSLTIRTKVHYDYQRIVKRVRIVAPEMLKCDQSGWVSLFRYFTERCRSEDDTMNDHIVSTLVRLAQASQRSIDDAVDCQPGTSDLEIAELADSTSYTYPEHLLASLSSLTGLPLPVVHNCITAQLSRHLLKVNVLNARKPLPLDVYSVPHSAKLRWAWR